ncbi:hypothetical protein A3728_17325 [Sulfitobacter sp. HI0040]|nr:hypothetical protein A3721_04850 [Sulfitobacter sp. HI0023]KZY25993.1 hypothetical protein A3728_17325 [Sulfitobacter sp. HI0040]KZZ67517.1 hypothetical protein A3764_14760 [Sulfitobacter sp. HI0129]
MCDGKVVQFRMGQHTRAAAGRTTPCGFDLVQAITTNSGHGNIDGVRPILRYSFRDEHGGEGPRRLGQRKAPRLSERGEVTNIRKNQFVGEYHLNSG